MTNMLDGTNYFLQDILNSQPHVIFESYSFYHIWGQYFDPPVILGWRYTRMALYSNIYGNITSSEKPLMEFQSNDNLGGKKSGTVIWQMGPSVCAGLR